MDILEIVKTRRSVRKFKDIPIPWTLIEKTLEAGRWAPSGMNNQPWTFATITDPAMIEDISKLTHYSKTVKSSKVLIPVFLDNANTYHRTKDVQAIGACIQNMLLEAHSVGLGAVWLGEIIRSNEEIKNLLGLRKELELMAVIAIGYPDEKPRAGKRKALSDLIVHRN